MARLRSRLSISVMESIDEIREGLLSEPIDTCRLPSADLVRKRRSGEAAVARVLILTMANKRSRAFDIKRFRIKWLSIEPGWAQAPP